MLEGDFRYQLVQNYHSLPISAIQMIGQNKGNECAYAELPALEQSGISNFKTYYCLVWKGNKLFSVNYFQVFQLLPIHFPDFSELSFAARKMYSALTCSRPVLLVNGNLFVNEFQASSFASSLTLKEKQTLYKRAYNLVSKTVKSNLFLVKEPDEELMAISKGISGLLWPDWDKTMELIIRDNWKKTEDYVQALSRKYAARFKKLELRMQEFEIELWDDKKMNMNWNNIEQLYQQVIQHSPVKLGILNAEYFICLKKNMPGQFHFFAWNYKQKLIGFSTLVERNKKLELYYIGLDYEANSGLQVYNCMIQHATKFAIENNFSSLLLGRTSYEAKSIVGATPVQQFQGIKLSGPLQKLSFNYALRYLHKTENTKIAERNPFRD